MFVVGIGTMALIIVLSVFNGLEDLLRNLYGNFDAQIIVQPVQGKSFAVEDSLREKIEAHRSVSMLTEVVEDNVLIKYQNSQRVVRMKGVSDNFLMQGRIDAGIVSGEPRLQEGDINYAIIGRGIQYDLSINTANDFFTLQLYYPRDIGPGVVDPGRLYRVRHVMPASIFAIEKYYDENYIFVPVELAADLLQYGNKRTSLEIELKEGFDDVTAKSELGSLLGDDYEVILGMEQHEDLYKILRIEKLFVFVIFALVIAIASINIYFSLTMLVIEKQKDIAILYAQGATSRMIRRIFLAEGSLIAFTGAFIGMFLGLAIAYSQQHFGVISMGMETTIMDAYPVKVEALDVAFSAVTIVFITFLASIQPAIKASQQSLLSEL